ncbi:integral membrane protein [Podospora didyma]|uniref:Integral membrane protein n=1 Tax=Podospora didyma TaxID=330526 RepID=A0AAE0NT56_9PEZI|nr:integral membrane protein [Podospora didyma]
MTPLLSAQSSATRTRQQRRWDDGIPPILRPLVRAYLLGYASAVAPRLLIVLLQHATCRRHEMKTKHASHDAQEPEQQPPLEPFLASLQRVLWGGLDLQRFPTFCAAIVGGSTLLKVPVKAAFDRLARSLSDIARERLSRWVASFIAAWLSLRLLQFKKTASFTETDPAETSDRGPSSTQKTIRYAGRTLDLTLFAATRALDVVVGELWFRRKLRRQAAHKPWTAVEKAVSRLVDPAMFALSSGVIMWTWIYKPSRLPRSYNKWIGSAAAVDGRLIEALRRCRNSEIRYGRDTGQAPLLGAMCVDFGWPKEWGDPAKSVPFPCELVHMGCGPSCEVHAVSRFMRSFRWAMATYLPLNLLLAVRNPSLNGLQRALISALRSSAFLGSFIALFYYGVCLARTRLGPHGVGTDPAARQTIDGGLCIGTGCFLCGWSVLIENARRRKDMALFVAPRALATFFPRRYQLDKQWRETVVFAASTAVVFTCVQENKARVRGVLGNVLSTVLNP